MGEAKAVKRRDLCRLNVETALIEAGYVDDDSETNCLIRKKFSNPGFLDTLIRLTAGFGGPGTRIRAEHLKELIKEQGKTNRRLGWKPSHDISRRREGFHHLFNRVIRESEHQS